MKSRQDLDLYWPTQNEPDHGAEVAGPAAQVEEGEAGMQLQSLHHLGVDARRRQMDVPMAPGEVLSRTESYAEEGGTSPDRRWLVVRVAPHLVGVVPVFIQVVVGPVDGPESSLHQICADVVSLLQVVDQVVVVLAGTNSSSHPDWRTSTTTNPTGLQEALGFSKKNSLQ